jgi:predicted MPP superfamily phosphohydrolase
MPFFVRIFFLVICAYCFGCGEEGIRNDSSEIVESPVSENAEDSINYPKNDLNYTDLKIEQIGSSENGFVFFTDTHIKRNKLKSTAIIETILKKTKIKRVVWGGDAITAFGPQESLYDEWNVQSKSFQSIRLHGKLYLVRGNHDLTKKNKKSKSRITLSQSDVKRLFMDNMENDVIMNQMDSLGMYYFFDDEKNKIRYIILESYFTEEDANGNNKIVAGATSKQISWIAKNAVLKTPPNFGIVFVMHAPVMTLSEKFTKEMQYIAKMIEAISLKKKVDIEDETYDFSQLINVEVLMVLSGHIHHDMQTFLHGTLHVTSASDANYKDYCRDPFLHQCVSRKGNKASCIDVFSFDLEKKIISAVRFGLGGNRIFHLSPVEIAVGKTTELPTSLSPTDQWVSYNAEGNLYKKSAWTIKNDIVSVSENGRVTGLQRGTAVVFARDSLENREFYNVLVK